MESMRILLLVLPLVLASCGNSKNDQPSTMAQENTSTASNSKAKLALFNDITATKNLLSQNGIGSLKNWRSDEMGGFISITDYFQFGSNATGIQNNLAYYLESDNVDCIKTLKLILNINNKGDKKQALTTFKEKSVATFKSLSLQMPKGLSDAITKEKIYQDSNEIFTTTLEVNKSNIDTWQLIIKSK